MDAPTPPAPVPKDYYLGFNYMLDRQSVTNLVALVQQAVGLNGKSVTICITSNGGAPDQALYAYEALSALSIPVPHARHRQRSIRRNDSLHVRRTPNIVARREFLISRYCI